MSRLIFNDRDYTYTDTATNETVAAECLERYALERFNRAMEKLAGAFVVAKARAGQPVKEGE